MREHAFTDPACLALLVWLERELSDGPKALVVGMGGPGGSGKSGLAHWLAGEIEEAEVLSLDSFRLPREQRPTHAPYGSHPDANDLEHLRAVLRDFRRRGTEGGAERRVLIAEGELAAHAGLRSEWDRLILVTASWPVLLRTRLTRDVHEHGFSLGKALKVFLRSNLRDYPRFAVGVEEAADVLVWRRARNGLSIREWRPRGESRGPLREHR